MKRPFFYREYVHLEDVVETDAIVGGDIGRACAKQADEQRYEQSSAKGPMRGPLTLENPSLQQNSYGRLDG